jgi:short-subunit dehydrogenase
MVDLAGKTALVTGASSGIGAAMARQLAAWGCDLVVTARRADRLEALADELRTAHGIGVRVVPEDLADPAAPARLFAAAWSDDAPLDIAINNAGFALHQPMLDSPWSRQAAMLQLNVTAVADLSYRFAEAMRARGGRRYLLNVASIAAFVPTVGLATYSASKAYVHGMSLGLAAELAGSGVSVTCLCPGPVDTEFVDVAEMSLNRLQRMTLMSPARCARIGLRGMLRGRRVVIPGLSVRLLMAGARVTPMRLSMAIGSRLLGSPSPPALPAEAQR